MIVVGGLGQMVFCGIGCLDMGFVIVGGVGIVIFVIIFDCLMQVVGCDLCSCGNCCWYIIGFVGLLICLFIK